MVGDFTGLSSSPFFLPSFLLSFHFLVLFLVLHISWVLLFQRLISFSSWKIFLPFFFLIISSLLFFILPLSEIAVLEILSPILNVWFLTSMTLYFVSLLEGFPHLLLSILLMIYLKNFLWMTFKTLFRKILRTFLFLFFDLISLECLNIIIFPVPCIVYASFKFLFCNCLVLFSFFSHAGDFCSVSYDPLLSIHF